MDSLLFFDQLRRPEPRALPRDRLEKRVLSRDAAPVALVLGPAGSGKTTLLSRVAARSTVPVAWYRASEDDADETAFASHLVCAVRLALGQDDGRSTGGQGSQSLASLVELLSVLGRPVSLVLDDLHEIAGTAAERALARLVAHRPEHIRLFLASRRAPSINTSRLLVSGQLVQIENEDLRFRSWEVEELFRAVYGEPLSPESAAALTRRTGGWAAGLQLFHLSTAGMQRGERERAVDRLSGRSRLIRSYLTGNVLEGLTEDRRDFLLRTSTLGVLSGPLCDALMETVGSAAVLNELEQQQFFTTSDDGGLTFRYHQVLQTHLEVVLVDELGVDRARALYLRSAALLEQSAGATAAVRAYVHAEDWGAVARLLRLTASTLPEDDPLWLAHALTNLPADDPTLIRAGARQLVRKGSVAQAVAAFGKAVDLMDDPEARRRCAVECARARVWLPDSSVVGDPPPADRLLRLSHDLRSVMRAGRDSRRTSFPLAQGLASLLAGDLDAAGQAFRQVHHDVRAGGAEQLGARLGALVAGASVTSGAGVAAEFELLLADA
ncbi:MAG TPA: AAA family ATPase, partial [Propionibacteriaceae bacterium]